VSDPASVTNWLGLLHWGGSILQPAKRGGKRHNLSTTLKNRISSFAAAATPVKIADSRHTNSQQTNSDNKLCQAVAAKLEDGNLTAAIRLLMSDETPVPSSDESLAKLRDKHPAASVKATDLPIPSQTGCILVEESEVRRAVLSFPPGSAGGPDGLRPQHIRDMLLCREAGSEFLSALTAFVNLVLAGGCPIDVAQSSLAAV